MTQRRDPVRFAGIDGARLTRAIGEGVDDGDNPIEPFIASDDGWTLRCCLGDSAPGDRLAIIAWDPFPWRGPYAETGPIVVHVDGCPGQAPLDRLPPRLDRRAMTLRPYGHDNRIAYDRVRHIPAGGSLTEQVQDLLTDPELQLVHGRNVCGGCFSFQAGRYTP